MTGVLVGGRKREDVLAQRKRSLEERTKEASLPSQGFFIQDHQTFWRINDVPDDNLGISFQIDLAKEVIKTDDKEWAVQDTHEAWFEHTQTMNEAQRSGQRRPSLDRMGQSLSNRTNVPSMVGTAHLYMSTFGVLMDHKNDPAYSSTIEDAQKNIQTIITSYSIGTMTRIKYHTGRTEDIVHAYHLTRNPPAKTARIFGNDGPLNNAPDKATLSNLIFLSTPERLETIFSWLTLRGPYLERVQNAICDPYHATVQIGIIQGKSPGIDISGASTRYPALGIRWRPIPFEGEDQ